MTEDIPRTPEGDLIRRARERVVPKLTIRAAAAAIGISPEHWGNVERGHKPAGKGQPPRRLDNVSPALIAKMAMTVHVTPAQLESADREDAARELRELLHDAAPDAEVIPLPVDPDDPIRKFAAVQRALGHPIDMGDPGIQVMLRLPESPERIAVLIRELIRGREEEARNHGSGRQRR